MMNEEEIKRYSRHLILPELGMHGQQKLRNASVLMIGAGGLGCPVLLYLAAAGVGRIGIVDDDTVALSNLHRQVLYTAEDIGRPKAIQAARKLEALNPHVQAEAYTERLTPHNIEPLFQDYDIIVDGTDNFATRYLVGDACVLYDKPLVFGSIFKFEGQVTVFNHEGGPTYRCLYPEPPAPGEVPGCAEIGVIGILPGMAGTLMANEVIKLITGIGEVLSGRLLVFDALAATFNTFAFDANPVHKEISSLIDYEEWCGTAIHVMVEVSADQLRNRLAAGEDWVMIDVRSSEEFERFNIGGTLLPISELEERRKEIPSDKQVVLVCQTGMRSKEAARLLNEKYAYANLYSLKGGLASW
jgi:molybdopterin/thiamine biosynthesis adenylyltransferase/rhodanese-related sulfurtransferase